MSEWARLSINISSAKARTKWYRPHDRLIQRNPLIVCNWACKCNVNQGYHQAFYSCNCPPCPRLIYESLGVRLMGCTHTITHTHTCTHTLTLTLTHRHTHTHTHHRPSTPGILHYNAHTENSYFVQTRFWIIYHGCWQLVFPPVFSQPSFV